MGDLPEKQLTPALREAVAHQLLTQDADRESYAFRHALLAEAILADLLPGERARLHLALAEALAADPALTDSAGNAAAELAFHWRACHRLDQALTASVEAGVQAESSYAFAEANRQFENALEVWAGGRGACRAGTDHAAILLGAVRTRAQWRRRTCRGAARSAVDEAQLMADPARAGLARERLGEFLRLAGDSGGAIEALRDAVDLLPSEPPGVERARVLAAEARILVSTAVPRSPGHGVRRRSRSLVVSVRALTRAGPSTRSASAC